MLQISPHGSYKKRLTLNNSTSSRTTLEIPFSRFAVCTVHIREVSGSSPLAYIYYRLDLAIGTFLLYSHSRLQKRPFKAQQFGVFFNFFCLRTYVRIKSPT